jgi:hypothetical protein
MINEYEVWELSKEKIADAQRLAAEARLAASVAGPDPTVRIATLLVLAIAGVVLFMMF